jgi:hypothetical protein
MSGNFTEMSGTGFNYGGTVSGGYFYHYHLVGTTTVTPGGTIYAATFTLDETDDYGYTWTDTATTNDTTVGQIASDTETSGTSGSSSFSHHEIGTYSNGGGLGSNGGYNPPTLSSSFTNTETDSYSGSNQDTISFNDGALLKMIDGCFNNAPPDSTNFKCFLTLLKRFLTSLKC